MYVTAFECVCACEHVCACECVGVFLRVPLSAVENIVGFNHYVECIIRIVMHTRKIV